MIVVDFHRFERANSHDVAQSVAHFNAKLGEDNNSIFVIGRYQSNSTDSWLGIPVAWDEISGARVIVESGIPRHARNSVAGEPFFSEPHGENTGYFTVNPDAGEGLLVDWQWLAGTACSRRMLIASGTWKFAAPLVVVMNGKTSQGMIFKSDTAP